MLSAKKPSFDQIQKQIMHPAAQTAKNDASNGKVMCSVPCRNQHFSLIRFNNIFKISGEKKKSFTICSNGERKKNPLLSFPDFSAEDKI